MAWVLRGCDRSIEFLKDAAERRSLDSKGFWRVDREVDPELRHAVLTQIAFHDLQQTIASHGGDRDTGIAAFCAMNDGDGWMLPETLRLADYGLGHDERAKIAQPVASRLGPRFYDWQLAQSVEESWAECERHARNLLGADGFAKLKAEIARGAAGAGPVGAEPGTTGDGKTRPRDLFGEPVETDLFGNVKGGGASGKKKGRRG